MKCQNCGATAEGAVSFCGYCGTPMLMEAAATATPVDAAVPPPLKSRDASVPSVNPASFPEPWGSKFALIERAGGAKLPKVRELSFGERSKIAFNVWGFLFGLFYYLAKGMPKKAATLVAVSLLIMVLMEAMGGPFAKMSGLVMAVIFAVRANIDYYKKVVHNDNGWW